MSRRRGLGQTLLLSLAVTGIWIFWVPVARAADVMLWACHGPAGEPLGVPPLVASTSGDGMISTYGSGCAAAASDLSAGGILARFTRPDPTAASIASWRLDVPDSVALQWVRVARFTEGFGGTAVAGGGISYSAETSAGALESARVDDASNAPLDGVFTLPAAGTYVRLLGRCDANPFERCASPTSTPIGFGIGSIALAVSDTETPVGAVGGLRNPASGELGLRVRATDAGLGLKEAVATVDGTRVARADLGGAACAELSPLDSTIDLRANAACPATVADAELRWNTRTVPDGLHQLRVVVTDAAGNSRTIADEQIRVANTPSNQTVSVPIKVGGGGPGSDDDDGGVGGTVVGGRVGSVLSIAFAPPRGFESFSRGATSRVLRLPVRITSTAGPPVLWVEEGKIHRGRRRGRLWSQAHRLVRPIEARVGTRAHYRRLTPLFGPFLYRWKRVVARARVTIRLRQRLTARDRDRRGPFRKVVLVTASTGTP